MAQNFIQIKCLKDLKNKILMRTIKAILSLLCRTTDFSVTTPFTHGEISKA